jgi:hypothetical protein
VVETQAYAGLSVEGRSPKGAVMKTLFTVFFCSIVLAAHADVGERHVELTQ